MLVSSRYTSNLLISGAFVSVVVALSYTLIDRPLSVYLETLHLSYLTQLRFFEHFPVAVAHVAVLTLAATPFLGKFQSTFPARAALRVAVSVGLATFIKDIFKGYFGRFWTRTWICDNPSLIGNQMFGFNWFHSGPAFGSFPSGHACVISAAAMAIALCLPSRRGVHVAVFLAALSSCAAVLAQNFHFLSDLVAGVWLGVAVSSCVAQMWPLTARSD